MAHRVRGLRKEDSGNTKGALKDYSSAIDICGQNPSDSKLANEKAMSLNARGVIKAKTGDDTGAIEDFTAVLDMDNIPAEQREESRHNLDLSKRNLRNS
jgi:hypothetical protein